MSSFSIHASTTTRKENAVKKTHYAYSLLYKHTVLRSRFFQSFKISKHQNNPQNLELFLYLFFQHLTENQCTVSLSFEDFVFVQMCFTKKSVIGLLFTVRIFYTLHSRKETLGKTLFVQEAVRGGQKGKGRVETSYVYILNITVLLENEIYIGVQRKGVKMAQDRSFFHLSLLFLLKINRLSQQRVIRCITNNGGYRRKQNPHFTPFLVRF